MAIDGAFDGTLTTEATVRTAADAELQDQIDALAASPGPHNHAISDVNGLQAALDDKADDGHGHVIGDTTGLQAALDAKADDGHTHTQAEVDGLTAALSDKQPLDADLTQIANDGFAAVLAAALRALGFSARSADGTQTVTNVQTVLWPTSAVAERGGISYSAGVFTVTVPGTYLVNASVNFANDATANGRRLAQIRRGTTIMAGSNTQATATGEHAVNVTAVFECVAGDTIDVRATNNSTAGALAITTTSRVSIRNLG